MSRNMRGNVKGRWRRRARAQAVRRRKDSVTLVRRSGLWGLLLLMVVIAAGGGAVWAWRAGTAPGLAQLAEKTTFPFRQIKVAGPFRQVSAAQVRDIAAPHAARGFFATDVAAIRQALQALPWVDNATVRRVWPDLLQITITEQVAVARWGGRDLLNTRGEIFTPSPAALARPPLADLPQLEGPAGSAPAMLAQYRAMAARLEPLGLRLARLVQERRGSWWVTLDNGIELALGKTAPLARLARFARYYRRLAAGREEAIAAVDLRYANGFVVRWRRQGAAAGLSG